jgi:hypothetical protein
MHTMANLLYPTTSAVFGHQTAHSLSDDAHFDPLKRGAAFAGAASVNLSVGMCRYVKSVGFISVGFSKKYLQHSDIQYVLLCVSLSLCAGMCRYVQVYAKYYSGNTCT